MKPKAKADGPTPPTPPTLTPRHAQQKHQEAFSPSNRRNRSDILQQASWILQVSGRFLGVPGNRNRTRCLNSEMFKTGMNYKTAKWGSNNLHTTSLEVAKLGP